MSIQLFHANLSPPSRVVRILIKLLGLKVEEKEINLMAGEHLKPEFTSINPFHVVPTLVDGDFGLWESRAILTYLVDKHSSGNSLYPTDLQTRATINRWLYWDAGTLFASLAAHFGPIFRGGSPVPEAAELFKTKAKDLDKSLENTKYVAGDSLTLADLTISVNITLASAVGIDLSNLTNVDRWLKQVESDLTSETWSTLVIEPANALGGFIKAKIASS